MSVELIDWNQGGENTIIQAARTCYDSLDKSTPESDERLIERLIKSGHHAMLEFGWVAFRIRCSRVVSHELVRHRVASYGMRSQRFVNESDPQYFIPPEIAESRHSVYTRSIYENAMRTAWNIYRTLLESGITKQVARYCLPNACMTELVMAGNYREWRHICQLRCSKQAQPEMRDVANQILLVLKEIAPRVFADIETYYV